MARTNTPFPDDPMGTGTVTKEDRHHATALFASRNAESSGNRRRDFELREMKRRLAEFLRRLVDLHGDQAGRPTFQAVQFSIYLREQGVHLDAIDGRTSGGLINKLKACGVIAGVGYAPNGGDPEAGHNSSVRPVYELLDLAKVPEEWT